RVAADPRLERRVVEAELLLVERDLQLRQQQPGPQRPRRVVLVPDQQLHADAHSISTCVRRSVAVKTWFVLVVVVAGCSKGKSGRDAAAGGGGHGGHRR